MFYSLCIALCLAVMFLVCSFTVLVSLPAARLVGVALRGARARTQANCWFLFRLFPFFLAAMATLGLVLPAFLEFEPPSTGEMMRWPLLALAGMGAALLALLAIRVVRMLRATGALTQRWISRSQKLKSPAFSFPLYSVGGESSLLAVTGVFRPQIFVSRDVAEALTGEELSAALAHELAHVRRFDNLKQIVLKSTQLPFGALRAADAGWTSASEVAADETAVLHGASALELSSALVKVARLSGKAFPPQRLAASHLVPCGCGASTGMRAAHLRTLLEKENSPMPATAARSFALGGKILAALAFVLMYFACVTTLLPAVHEALELLVR